MNNDFNPGPISGDGEAVFCTMDAKICPDGSYVGRVAPDCEFAPCPGEDAYRIDQVPLDRGEPVFCPQDVQICSDGSYVNRVAPSCEFALGELRI